ncbi:inosine-5-monophosphate dehydrogenase [Adhaeribacter aerolatus]|uniref:Inosine-5-monophosphate dehydrogenase n=1 Tax=Adhaeribacter aerolatus TaxID=670289 RepID=A0A512AZP5_9BACT|nr:CBS domain-containing protein [Adhaeribacter aerolatus]GEO05185.1 inosine-5-monophosphate dehydrogenase [Adhaeribacter aerolatus]
MSKVRNILQKKGNLVFSISPNDTVFNGLELMVENNLGALLVVDNGHFIGIFTERDYARKVILRGKASKETLVREIMSEHPATVTPDTTIEDCMKIMTSTSGGTIRHLPVLEKGELAGLISMGDVVRFIMDEQRIIIEDLEHYISGR